jgi:hypothetical protein
MSRYGPPRREMYNHPGMIENAYFEDGFYGVRPREHIAKMDLEERIAHHQQQGLSENDIERLTAGRLSPKDARKLIRERAASRRGGRGGEERQYGPFLGYPDDGEGGGEGGGETAAQDRLMEMMERQDPRGIGIIGEAPGQGPGAMIMGSGRNGRVGLNVRTGNRRQAAIDRRERDARQRKEAQNLAMGRQREQAQAQRVASREASTARSTAARDERLERVGASTARRQAQIAADTRQKMRGASSGSRGRIGGTPNERRGTFQMSQLPTNVREQIRRKEARGDHTARMAERERTKEFEEYQKAQADREREIRELHENRRKDALQTIRDAGSQYETDIKRRGGNMQSEVTQDLVGRGLAASTAGLATRSAINRSTNDSIAADRARRSREEADIMLGTSGDYAGFLERIDDVAPPRYLGMDDVGGYGRRPRRPRGY